MTDVGKYLLCRVTATNPTGSVPAFSNVVGPVVAGSGGGGTTTFDPANTAADLTLSGGNLTAINTTSIRGCTRSIATASSGKKYFELLLTTISATAANVLGIVNATAPLSGFPGLDANGIGVAFNGSIYIGGSEVANTGIGAVAGDRVCIAIDFDAEKFWVRKNGNNWNPPTLAGDPTDPGTGQSFATVNAGPYYACLALKDASDACTVNFGATAYTHPVPSGYGNF